MNKAKNCDARVRLMYYSLDRELVVQVRKTSFRLGLFLALLFLGARLTDILPGRVESSLGRRKTWLHDDTNGDETQPCPPSCSLSVFPEETLDCFSLNAKLWHCQGIKLSSRHEENGLRCRFAHPS